MFAKELADLYLGEFSFFKELFSTSSLVPIRKNLCPCNAAGRLTFAYLQCMSINIAVLVPYRKNLCPCNAAGRLALAYLQCRSINIAVLVPYRMWNGLFISAWKWVGCFADHDLGRHWPNMQFNVCSCFVLAKHCLGYGKAKFLPLSHAQVWWWC